MKTTQVALYARVSSEQQNEARTIASQLADLRTRITATGADLAAELEFVDTGYSGATLIRPALERLRDVAAARSAAGGHVQGMIAAYERAKILERSRRGKRHGAQVGKVSVLGGAPYGYRSVSRQEGAGEASFEMVWEEARVVRQAVSVGRTRSMQHWRGSSSSGRGP